MGDATTDHLATRLAGMPDDELRALAPATHVSSAWGTSGPVTIDGAPAFLKRVPLTDLEASRPNSTRNHFKLPPYYSYGVGSAGFGVWRELALHEATSAAPRFPSLLHHRVMDRADGTAEEVRVNGLSLDEYVTYWNGSHAVRNLMEARRDAGQDVWIFLEHVPHMIMLWLIANQSHAREVFAQVFEAVDVLREQDVVHFDAHLGNVVTDGTRCRLTDFGLGMSAAFELSAQEKAFMDRHRHYDYGVALGHLGQMLMFAMGGTPTLAQLARTIDELPTPAIAYEPELVSVFRQYRAPLLYMVDFFQRIRRPSKRARYDDGRFAELFRQAHSRGLAH